MHITTDACSVSRNTGSDTLYHSIHIPIMPAIGCQSALFRRTIVFRVQSVHHPRNRHLLLGRATPCKNRPIRIRSWIRCQCRRPPSGVYGSSGIIATLSPIGERSEICWRALACVDVRVLAAGLGCHRVAACSFRATRRCGSRTYLSGRSVAHRLRSKLSRANGWGSGVVVT